MNVGDIVELIDESEYPLWSGRMTVVAVDLKDDFGDDYVTCVHPDMTLGAFESDKLVVMDEADGCRLPDV